MKPAARLNEFGQSAWLDVRLIGISVWISLRLHWEDRGRRVGRGDRRGHGGAR